jgi:hypothetical protein
MAAATKQTATQIITSFLSNSKSDYSQLLILKEISMKVAGNSRIKMDREQRFALMQLSLDCGEKIDTMIKEMNAQKEEQKQSA